MAVANSYMEKLNTIIDDSHISQKNCVEKLKALKSLMCEIQSEEPVQPHHLDTLESILQESLENNAILENAILENNAILEKIEGLLKVFDTGK